MACKNTHMVLRPLTEQDVTPGYVSWLNDGDIFRYLGIRHRTRPFDPEDVVRFLNDCIRDQRYHWGIFIDERHVGNVSSSEWNNENKWIDISYIIGDKSLYGQGIATTAFGAAINYLFKIKKFNRIQAHAVIENIASIRVMEKLNMHRDAVLRQIAYLPKEGRYSDEVIYSILRAEWKAPPSLICEVQLMPMPWDC